MTRVPEVIVSMKGEEPHRETRTFGTMTIDLLDLSDWLMGVGIVRLSCFNAWRMAAVQVAVLNVVLSPRRRDWSLVINCVKVSVIRHPGNQVIRQKD
jgi:hypothetical protein